MTQAGTHIGAQLKIHLGAYGMREYDHTLIVRLDYGKEFDLGADRLSKKNKGAKIRPIDKAEPALQQINGAKTSKLYVMGHGNNGVNANWPKAQFMSVPEKKNFLLPVTASTAADMSPEEVAKSLYDKGLRKCTMIYLVVCNSGRGGETSFAKVFADKLRGYENVEIGEVRAPCGYVKVDADGHKKVAAKGAFHRVGEDLKFVSSAWETEIDKDSEQHRVSF